MNIFFRTNYNNKIGIGHIIRCNRLANEFSKLGHNCYFFFDNLNSVRFINYKSFSLNTKKNVFNELSDARNFCKYTRKIGKGYVIVDDYRLGYSWERFVSKYHKKVILIDDLNNKEHFSDYIINYNPKNFPEIKYNFSFNKKKGSKFLIHPNYNIISQKKIIKNYEFKKNFFYITFYIGGGGNLILISKIILSMIQNKNLSKNIKFLVILGDLAKNKELIKKISKKNKCVEFYEKGDNLYYIIKKTDIFVGTTGTALFETAFLKTPSILFKISKNQDTDVFSLENLGHFIFLDYKSINNIKKISNLIILLSENYKRLSQLNKNPLIKIDNKGSSRILKNIFSKSLREKIIKSKKNFTFDKNLKIEKVNDRNINHYLYCRNLNLNRRNSSNNKKITTIDHYNWWFATQRKSYVLSENGKKILYFYDEEIALINKKKYFLSGWFACSTDCSIRHILFALDWQRRIRKNVIWISFVNKTNHLALKYSKYVGWKILNKNNKVISLLKQNFNLNIRKFIFFERQA